MKRLVKLSLLALARALGLFVVARFCTRHEARILCYHGFAYRDEHDFAPKLFMHPATFAKRMARLRRSGYQVVSLATLVQRLQARQPIDRLVVITVDDGWTGFARFAWPTLQQHALPATLYLTTWYAEKERPVLNVLRRYLVWHGLSLPAEQADNLAEYRQLQAAAAAAGLSLACSDGELFRLSTPAAIAAMAQQGLDVQLHTHRHCLPLAPDELANELQQNRQRIEALTGKPAADLCYPSGDYHAAHLPLLQTQAVRSATTTRLGLVNADSDLLQLPRLLDGENWHTLEFDAELSGFASLLRRWRGRDDSAGLTRPAAAVTS